MKQFILSILILFCANSAVAQTAEHYFDQYGEEIEKRKFKKMVEAGFFKLKKEEGREVHHFLLDREQKGQLNATFLQTFQSAMKSVDERVKLDKYIAVLYHPGLDECNRSYLDDEYSYLASVEPGEEFLKNTYHNPVQHIYKNADGLAPYLEKFSWTKDPNGLLQKLFFPHHYPCGSYVIVHPEGYYYAFLGEYSINSVANAKYEFDDIIAKFSQVEGEIEMTEQEKAEAKKKARKKKMKKKKKRKSKRKRK